MLTITRSAWDRLSKIQTDRPKVTAIRLRYADGQLRCCSGSRKNADRVIERADGPTLLLSPAVAADLSERTLDAPDTDRGPRLRLKPEHMA